MHSLASTLVAAALATLTCAAPVDLPVNLPPDLAAGVPPAAVDAITASVPLLGTIPPIGQISSVEDEIGSLTGALRVRDVTSKITDAVKYIGARDAQLSVAVIFGDILTEIQPYTEQLSTLNLHPYDPRLTFMDSLPRFFRLHDRHHHRHCCLNQGPHRCGHSAAGESRWR